MSERGGRSGAAAVERHGVKSARDKNESKATQVTAILEAVHRDCLRIFESLWISRNLAEAFPLVSIDQLIVVRDNPHTAPA